MASSMYLIRRGAWGDVPAATDLYLAGFDKEPILDFLFPTRRADPAPFIVWLTRRFRIRYWTPGYWLTVAVQYEAPQVSNGDVERLEETEILEDEDEHGNRDDAALARCAGPGRPVGITWWHRPEESLSFRERWLSWYGWFAPMIRSVFVLHDRLFPIPGVNRHDIAIYDRVLAQMEPQILSTPRRRAAWYLSTLTVDPACQGCGLGAALVRRDLRHADRAGAATWLVGLHGLENYYNRFGYVLVARLNVGELKDWNGGYVMFRGE